MRDQNPIRTARRKARQGERERNGIAASPCVLCIEDHHTAGKHHDSLLTAPLCRMHHRDIHEQLLRAGIPLTFEPDEFKRAALALRSMAVYDRARAGAMERWATLLDAKGEQNELQSQKRRKQTDRKRTSQHLRSGAHRQTRTSEANGQCARQCREVA